MKPFTPCADAEREAFTPEEQKRIAFMRDNCVLDPDGYDTVEEIRLALGKAHPSETIGDFATRPVKTPSNRDILKVIEAALQNYTPEMTEENIPGPEARLHPEDDSIQLEYCRSHDVDVFIVDLKHHANFSG